MQMVKYMNRLFLVIAVLVAAFYVLYLNRSMVTVHLTWGWSYSSYLGVFLIASFFVGILVASLVTLYFATQAYLNERRLLRRERERREFLRVLVKARELIATGDYETALKEWRNVAYRDPTESIAQIEIARTLDQLGRNDEALDVLSEVRVKNPENSEVLLVAAQLAKRAGNKTAALDNIEFLIKKRRSPELIEEARDLALALGLFSKAQHHQNLLDNLSRPQPKISKRIKAEIAFEELGTKYAVGSGEYLEALRLLCKKQPFSLRALHKLAELEREGKHLEASGEALLRAAQLLETTEAWVELANFWLLVSEPKRAISSLRQGVKELSHTVDAREAKLLLGIRGLKMSLELNLLTEAEKFLQELSLEETHLNLSQRNEKLALEGLLALRQRAVDRAEKALSLIQ